MDEQSISLVLERLAALRTLLPADRSRSLPADSTWLHPAERDDRLDWVLEQAGAVLVELDQHARLIYVSPSSERILGHPPGDFEGLYVGDAVHPSDLERLVDVSRAMGEGSAPNRTRLRVEHSNGSWVHLEAVSAARFIAADGTIHSVSVLCDVTQRHEAWSALRASEERYRVIAESSRDVIAEVNETGLHTFSAGLEEVLGYTAGEMEGMEPYAITHPDDLERVRKELDHAFATGETVSIEPFRVFRKDGTTIWYECAGITYRTGEGERRFLTVGRDVSQRMLDEEERRAFEARRQQAQRLESLGILAGGIAHDFNNLLTPILGETRLVMADLPEGSPLHGRLDRAYRAARRAADLTQQMLANAGADRMRATPLDLCSLVEEMMTLVAPAAGVEVDTCLPTDLPWVEGDSSQLGQVITNLLTNAIEAIGERGSGQVLLRAGCTELESRLDSDPPGLTDPLPPGRYVFLEVEDSGCGMDDSTRSRIFDPFFTTKFTGRGLGLAAVIGIVRSHQGGIEIDSQPGRGSCFRIWLPVTPGARREAGLPASAPPPA